MRINSSNNLNFQSRNKTIRFADDVARRVNKCYPRVSTTKLLTMKNAENFGRMLNDIASRISSDVREEKDYMYDYSESFLDKIKSFIQPVKKNKLGNCAESAQIAAILAKINGIKDCHLACLYNTNGEDFDHAVLFVNDKKPYIIDAWLGLADYVPNMLQRYKNEFNYIFEAKPEERLTFTSSIDDEYTDFLKNNFTRKQINKLKRVFPEQFIRPWYMN